MSFTSRIKNELVESELSKLETVSELSGLLKNSIDNSSKLNISTENASIARFIFNSLKSNYDTLIRVSVKRGYNYSKNYIYGLEVYKNVDSIIKDLSLDSIVPNSYLIDDEDYVISIDCDIKFDCKYYISSIYTRCLHDSYIPMVLSFYSKNFY